MSASRSLPRLIAVHGFKRSGKSVISARLREAHGYTQAKFAGALKDMSRVLIRATGGLSEADVERCIEGDLKEVAIPFLGGKSCRYTQQTIGTEWRDSISPTMWTHMTLAEMRAAWAAGGRVIIDDLRFDHEVGLIKPEGATLWVVTTNRPLHAVHGSADLPWGLSAPATLDIGDDLLRDMLEAMLGHCGLPPGYARRGAWGDLGDLPLEVLGGHTPAHCLQMLHEVWMPLMRLPWVASSSVTSSHASERPLPRDIFDCTFHNDGTIADLQALVDDALATHALAA